jgi:hypothetical protein
VKIGLVISIPAPPRTAASGGAPPATNNVIAGAGNNVIAGAGNNVVATL